MNSLKTYLMAYILMGSSLFMLASEIDESTIIAESARLEEERQVNQAVGASTLHAENRRLREDEQIQLALAISASEVDSKIKTQSSKQNFTTIYHQVHPQTNLSCGLHAIDNGNKAYQCLFAGESLATLKRHLLQPLSAEAQQEIDKNMLDSLRIQKVSRTLLHMDQHCFSCLENILQGKEELLKPLPQKTDKIFYIPNTLGTAIEAFRTQRYALHVFIIANTEITQTDNKNTPWGNFAGRDDHWIAIVAEKKDGIITFHYMDTLGGRNNNFITALHDIIMFGNYHGMQLAVELDEYDPAILNTYIERADYATVVTHIQKQIDLAHAAGVLDDAGFPKQRIRQCLINLIIKTSGSNIVQRLAKLATALPGSYYILQCINRFISRAHNIYAVQAQELLARL